MISGWLGIFYELTRHRPPHRLSTVPCVKSGSDSPGWAPSGQAFTNTSRKTAPCSPNASGWNSSCAAPSCATCPNRAPPDLPPDRLTTRWQDLIDDPAVDIVVELMGGIDEPLALIRAAIEAGKIVVTGNKALLAEHGQEIFALAAERKVPVFFEASTAGGIPIIKTIREALIANHIVSIHGIINGTSNYILTRMTDAGLDFAAALAEAQAQGYAEADPTLDINGWDAAHKAIILASLAYGFWVGTDQIFVEGIDKLTATDIRFADELGYRVKLLAIIKADGGPERRTAASRCACIRR